MSSSRIDPRRQQSAQTTISVPTSRRGRRSGRSLSDESDPAAARNPVGESLLLDPSVLLGDEGFGWLQEVPHDARTRFVVAQTFFDQVAGRVEYTEADEELWGTLPDGPARRQLEALVAGLTTFSESDAVGELPPEVTEVADRLRSMGSQVAVEEWLYLHYNSLLTARSRKILEHFKRGGAKVVEVAGDGIDDLTWLALGKRPGTQVPLTKELRIKAGINVVVIGGVATVTFFLPWFAIPAGIAVFLLNPYMQPA